MCEQYRACHCKKYSSGFLTPMSIPNTFLNFKLTFVYQDQPTLSFYLQNRSQYAKINSHISLIPVHIGIPQGSVSRLFLFRQCSISLAELQVYLFISMLIIPKFTSQFLRLIPISQ